MLVNPKCKLLIQFLYRFFFLDWIALNIVKVYVILCYSLDKTVSYLIAALIFQAVVIKMFFRFRIRTYFNRIKRMLINPFSENPAYMQEL